MSADGMRDTAASPPLLREARPLLPLAASALPAGSAAASPQPPQPPAQPQSSSSSSSALQGGLPPPPPRDRNKKRRASAKMRDEAGSSTRASAAAATAAAAASSAVAAAAAAAAAAASPAASSGWAATLLASQSYNSVDTSSPNASSPSFELLEERATFQRFLNEHFRPLTHVDLLKLGAWTQLQRDAENKQAEDEAARATTVAADDSRRSAAGSARRQSAAAAPSTRRSSAGATAASSDAVARGRPSPFTLPSPLIFQPKSDPSFIVPPLGVTRTTAAAATVEATTATTDVEQEEASAPRSSNPDVAAEPLSSSEDGFDSCLLPSVADETALLLQLGLVPPTDALEELQHLVSEYSTAPPATGGADSPAPQSSSPDAATSAAPTASTSVLVMLSNPKLRSSATTASSSSSPSAAHADISSYASELIADSLDFESATAAPHVLCEYVLTTQPATHAMTLHALQAAPRLGHAASIPVDAAQAIANSSSNQLFSVALSAVQRTHSPPRRATLAKVWPEVEALATAREEQLEHARRKRIREIEAEERRKALEEERRAAEIELALSRKQSVATVAAAAAAAAAASASASPPAPSTDDAQRMEIDGEPLVPPTTVKLEQPQSMDIGSSNGGVLLGVGSMALPPLSVPGPLSAASSPAFPRSRVTTPVPSDPDQLLKELLSLQLQLAHQSASNAQRRQAIVRAVHKCDLQSYQNKIDADEEFVRSMYQRASRWQSVRLCMKRGTGDVLLPPALLTFHKHKYSYDVDDLHSVVSSVPLLKGESVPPSSSLVGPTDVELERALLAEAFALDDYSVCSVCFATGPCFSALSDDDQSVANTNPLLFCEVCNVCVHQYCYGLASLPEEGEWTCQWCVAHPPQDSTATTTKPSSAPSPPPAITAASSPAPSQPASVSAPSSKRISPSASNVNLSSSGNTSSTTPPVSQPSLSVGMPLGLPMTPSSIQSMNALLNPFLSPQLSAQLFSSLAATLTPMQLAALMGPPLSMGLTMPTVQQQQLLPSMHRSKSAGDCDAHSSHADRFPANSAPPLANAMMASTMMDIDSGASSGGDPSASPMSPPPLTGGSAAAAAAAVAAAGASAKASAKALARKNAAMEKAAKKQRELEQDAERQRREAEAERMREAAKRAERRRREEELPLPCCLCTVRGGALKPTDELDINVPGYLQQQRSGRTSGPPRRLWAHIVCALWLPRTSVEDTSCMQPIRGVHDAYAFRFFKHGLPPSEEQLQGKTEEENSTAHMLNAYGVHTHTNLHTLTNVNPLNLLTSGPGGGSSMTDTEPPTNITAPAASNATGGSSTQGNNLNPNAPSNALLSAPFAPFSPGLLPFAGGNLNLSLPFLAGGLSNLSAFNLMTGGATGAGGAGAPFFFPTPAVELNANSGGAAGAGSMLFSGTPPGLAGPNSAPWASAGAAGMLTSDAVVPGSSPTPPAADAQADSNEPAGPAASPFLVPLPSLPAPASTNSPALKGKNNVGALPVSGGISGAHAAQFLSTLAEMQSAASSNAALLATTSPRLAATANTSSPPTFSRAVSLPVIHSTTSPLLPPSAGGARGGAAAGSLASLPAAVVAAPPPVARQNGVCGLCKKAYGCCTWCSADMCNESFHPLCAWYAGLYMRVSTVPRSTDVLYSLFCSSHTPLHALGIELVDAADDAEDDTTADASGSSKTQKADEQPDSKRRKKGQGRGVSAATAPTVAPMPVAVEREPTFFPWIRFPVKPTSPQCVADFAALFLYRNKVRLLQQREYRNRGRQEQTKKAKMQRKKRRLRLYGPQEPSGVAADGTPLAPLPSRRRHVRTAADGTQMFDRSTRGESKLHCREDQYELGRCAVCFFTDEEIRSKEKWEADKIMHDWEAQCAEALSMGYAPPPKPQPAAPAQPQPSSSRRKSSTTVAAAAIPPHVAAFHACNPLLRCCECEIEVHARCYGVQYEEVQAQIKAQERRQQKLQRVVKLGGGFKAGNDPSVVLSLSAPALQAELDELHAQFEDELADELEEAEDNTTQWRCRRCVEKDKDISCALCMRKGGAFKRTDSDSWVHLVCALWIPELVVGDQYLLEPVTGLDEISPARRRLKCYLCRRSGPCIECSEASCSQAFHPLCGMLSGQLMLEVGDSANSTTFISSCRRHTALHMARFISLPADYTAQVWEKKRLDNARTSLEVMAQRAADGAEEIEALIHKQVQRWSDARRDALAPPPPPSLSPSPSAPSTPAPPSSSSSRRRRGGGASAGGGGGAGTSSGDLSASPSPMPSPSATPLPSYSAALGASGASLSSSLSSSTALTTPSSSWAQPSTSAASATSSSPSLNLLEHLWSPGINAAAFTIEFYRQMQLLGKAQQMPMMMNSNGSGGGSSSSSSAAASDKRASAAATNAAMALASSQAALLSMSLPTLTSHMAGASGSGGGEGTSTASAPSFTVPSVTSTSSKATASGAAAAAAAARRSSASAASSPISEEGEEPDEDDLPLANLQLPPPSSASSAAPPPSTPRGRRSAGGASSSHASASSAAASPAVTPSPSPSPSPAGGSLSGRKRKISEEAALMANAQALLAHGSSSAAGGSSSSSGAASKRKPDSQATAKKGRGAQTRGEEKEQR